jgi:tartrate dehydratase alpha subunit/fumarate hydratase class I-like protein
MEKPTKYAKGGGCELKGKPKTFAMGGMMRDMARKAMAQRPQVGMAGPQAMPQSPMGDESMPRRGGLFRGIKERVAQRVAPQPMPQQRGGLSNMSPEAKSKIGDALAKMMGGVRSTGAKTMASRGDTGFNAPNMMDDNAYGAKKGGSVKTFAKGGGCELKGKTKGRMI